MEKKEQEIGWGEKLWSKFFFDDFGRDRILKISQYEGMVNISLWADGTVRGTARLKGRLEDHLEPGTQADLFEVLTDIAVRDLTKDGAIIRIPAGTKVKITAVDDQHLVERFARLIQKVAPQEIDLSMIRKILSRFTRELLSAQEASHPAAPVRPCPGKAGDGKEG